MPLRDFTCPTCGEAQERFFHGHPEDVRCRTCQGPLEVQPLNFSYHKSAVFPFDCPHIDGTGRMVTVESLGHLRALERQHGVCLTAFSQNPGNPDSPRDLPVFKGRR